MSGWSPGKPDKIFFTAVTHCFPTTAKLTVTSAHIVFNMPNRGLLAVESKDSFVVWLAKFKYQKTGLITFCKPNVKTVTGTLGPV